MQNNANTWWLRHTTHTHKLGMCGEYLKSYSLLAFNISIAPFLNTLIFHLVSFRMCIKFPKFRLKLLRCDVYLCRHGYCSVFNRGAALSKEWKNIFHFAIDWFEMVVLVFVEQANDFPHYFLSSIHSPNLLLHESETMTKTNGKCLHHGDVRLRCCNILFTFVCTLTLYSYIFFTHYSAECTSIGYVRNPTEKIDAAL